MRWTVYAVAAAALFVPRAAAGQTSRFQSIVDGDLTGAQVVPASSSIASGYSVAWFDAVAGGIVVHIEYSSLGSNSTAIHVHGPAAPGANGALLFTIPSTPGTSGQASELYGPSAAELTAYLQGLWYVDIHTTGRPNGEIRAQLLPEAAIIASLRGNWVVPPTGAAATGNAFITLNQDRSRAWILLEYYNLSGDGIFGAFHGPAAPGSDGGLVLAFGMPAGTNSGGSAPFSLTPAQAAELVGGQWYFIVTSAAFPNGEIRGQLKLPNRVTDFDADARAEVGVFRPSTGVWYTLNPGTNAFTARQFGISTDQLSPGDYDGDGRTDLAVWRNGTFWILDSTTGNARARAFGATADDPRVSADYDGDGHADLAVYRRGAPGASFFYHLQSFDGAFRDKQFGNSDDVSLLGDYDGDRKSDVAVYRTVTNTYYVSRSALGFQAQPFGNFAIDLLTPGDYDGDGKTDFAVFRFQGPDAGTWYILQSSTGTMRGQRFGFGTDVPAPADFDGDGKTDLAVHRINPSDGTRTWFVLRSSTSTLAAFVFGVETDQTLQSYLIR